MSATRCVGSGQPGKDRRFPGDDDRCPSCSRLYVRVLESGVLASHKPSGGLTTVQYSALGDLRRFGRLYPPGPRQHVQRGTDQGFSRRTLQALVDAGHAQWAPPRDGTWPSIIPTQP